VAETFAEITDPLAEFIARQPVFFVGTAPLAPDGLVNVSPKGLDTFRILDPRTVAYLDLTGSGIETVSHLRENGRVCVMFCAFEGPARILRLHGRGEVVEAADPRFGDLYARFPPREHARAVVVVAVERVATSCGYAVPLMQLQGERAVLDTYWERRGEELLDYRREKNAVGIDGLAGLVLPPVRPPARDGDEGRGGQRRGVSASSRPPSSS